MRTPEEERPSETEEHDGRTLLSAFSQDPPDVDVVVESTWEVWDRLVRQCRVLHRSAHNEDDFSSVLCDVLEKLRDDEGKVVRQFHEWQRRHPEKSILDWARIVVANLARDHLKATDQRRTKSNDLSRNALLRSFFDSVEPDAIGARPPMTDAQTARQLLDYAKAHLPEKQYAILCDWLRGHSFEDIRLAHTTDDPEAMVRAAVATLRRKFARRS